MKFTIQGDAELRFAIHERSATVTVEFPLELAEVWNGEQAFDVEVIAAALEHQCDAKKRKLILTIRERKKIDAQATPVQS